MLTGMLGGMLTESGMLTGMTQDLVWLKLGGCTVGSSLGDSGTFWTMSEGATDPWASIAGAGT